MAASEKPTLETCGSTCTKRTFCDLRRSKWPSLTVWMTEPPHPLRVRAPCFCEWDPPQESWPKEPCYRASPKSGLTFLSCRGCNYGDGHCHLLPKSSQLRFIVSILPLSSFIKLLFSLQIELNKHIFIERKWWPSNPLLNKIIIIFFYT